VASNGKAIFVGVVGGTGVRVSIVLMNLHYIIIHTQWRGWREGMTETHQKLSTENVC